MINQIQTIAPSAWSEPPRDLLNRATPYGLFQSNMNDLYLIAGDRHGKFAVLLASDFGPTSFCAFKLRQFPDDIGTYLGPLQLRLIGLEDDECDLGTLRFQQGCIELMCCLPDESYMWLPIGLGPTEPVGATIQFNRWAMTTDGMEWEFENDGTLNNSEEIWSEMRSFCPQRIQVDATGIDLVDIQRRGFGRGVYFEPVYLRDKP